MRAALNRLSIAVKKTEDR